MAAIDLTQSHKMLLTALVNLNHAQGEPINAETLAEEVDRASGTIRNQMQQLKSLQLVEGFSGPRGGYAPTAAAYETLNLDQIDEPAVVPTRRNGTRVEEANVDQITLTNVAHPEQCRAEIRVRGSLEGYRHEDEIRVGPTPHSKLVIHGSVEGTDKTTSMVILQIEGMVIEGAKAE